MASAGVGLSCEMLLELVEYNVFLLRDLQFMLFEKGFIDLKLGQFNLVSCFLYVSIIYSCLCGKLSWWRDEEFKIEDFHLANSGFCCD